MDQNQLNQARTNPDFLQYLQQTQNDAIETKNIAALYEVLDSLLILDLDEEDRINTVYENILQIAFDQVEGVLNQNKKLSLENDELYYVRAFYEHAIEKWSIGNFTGANELFFVLSQIVENKTLTDALDIHIIECAKHSDMETFYTNCVDTQISSHDEKLGYFIVNFVFDTKQYIEQYKQILDQQYQLMQHLLQA